MMTRFERNANLAAVILPFAGFLFALWQLWNSWVGPTDLAILAVTYLLGGMGITVGFHRLLTHRAFEVHRPTRYLLAILGSTSLQGPVIDWVADHRKHHTFTDAEGDPHSPHVGHGSGLRGLWHAHTGWLFETQGQAEKRRYARDLLEDPTMRWISKAFGLWAALSLLVPFVAGWALTGTLHGAVTGLLWGGLVRIFLLHHVTWSVNSICHFFGSRRFALEDRSTNVFWLALPSFGEAWHHNHHAFPRSAEHGLRGWELDPSAWVIRGLERLGLAWNVVRVPHERQRSKEQARIEIPAVAPVAAATGERAAGRTPTGVAQG